MRTPAPPLSPARRLAIVEVAVAAAVLTLVLFGTASALLGARQCQIVSRQRQAATLAASSQLQDLVVVGNVDEAGWTSLNAAGGWHQLGFPVTLQPGLVGVSEDYSGASSGTAGSLPAAATASALWPASRAAQGAAVLAQAGYIEVVDVAGRDGLKQITVVVAWQSSAGSEERVVLSQFVFNPDYTN
jgi:hypothetical protein